MAVGRTVAGEIMRRSAPIPTPLRRGAAAAVATGSALTLAGLAATIPLAVDPTIVAAAAVLPATDPLTSTTTVEPGDEAAPTTLVPVRPDTAAPATEKLDTANLVKAVQLAERTLTGGKTAVPAPSAPNQENAPADPEATDDQGADQEPADDPEPDAATDETAGPERGGTQRTDEPNAEAATTACGLDTGGLGRVKPHVRAAAQFLGCRFGEPEMFGVAGRAGSSDHPGGRAVDFMVNRASGNALAECALSNQDALGISYVIWRQRINFGSGWEPMADRGGVTANHFDHVHISFESGAGGSPRGC